MTANMYTTNPTKCFQSVALHTNPFFWYENDYGHLGTFLRDINHVFLNDINVQCKVNTGK